MELGLQNKNALVCGSTQGIGKATAISLAKEGVNITLMARNEKVLQGVLKELPQNGKQKHRYLVANFSNLDQIKNIISPCLRSDQEMHVNQTFRGNIQTAIVSRATEHHNHLKSDMNLRL